MLDIWEESYVEDENDEDQFLEEQACLTYDDLCLSGQATRPLEFPTPRVYDAVMTDLTASDHNTGVEYDLKRVLRRSRDPERAYLIHKKLARSTYGFVKLAVVLRRVEMEDRDSSRTLKVQWQSTNEFVAIKCSSWDKIQAMRGRHLVDPIKEISVLQLIGNGDMQQQHVMGCIEVLQDSQYLYTVVQYCGGGDLLSKLEMDGELQLYPDEDEARKYFQQLLSALIFLQRKGICHRNVCMENLLLDRKNRLVLIDSGVSLRVPYSDPCNDGEVTDVSEGSRRRLMKPQGQCGKLKYLAPEMLDDQKPFDGHATDLWAAGICLFITLVGVAPFEVAQRCDKRFDKISCRGELQDFLQSLDVSLSPEALNLLQNMLWCDPRDRLTLGEVLGHPWVLGQRLLAKSTMTTYATMPATKNTAANTKFHTMPIPKKRDKSLNSKTTSPSIMGKSSDKCTLEKSTVTSYCVDPATVSTVHPQGKKRRKKLSSGARDLLGKLRFMVPATKKIGCGASSSHQNRVFSEKHVCPNAKEQGMLCPEVTKYTPSRDATSGMQSHRRERTWSS